MSVGQSAVPFEGGGASGGRNDCGKRAPSKADAAISLFDEDSIFGRGIGGSGDKGGMGDLEDTTKSFGVSAGLDLGGILIAIDKDSDGRVRWVIEGEFFIFARFEAMGLGGLIE